MSTPGLRAAMEAAQSEAAIPVSALLEPKPAETGNAAFFYGTLMHPAVIRRVIANNAEHLEICPAILFNHTRYHVQDEDYPAVVPSSLNATIQQGKELDGNDTIVRGVVVRGLTARDVELLDFFEGNEYTREQVTALPLSKFFHLNSAPTTEILSQSAAIPSHTPSDLIPTFTYIWSGPVEDLGPEAWDYDTFVREKLWRWSHTGYNGGPDKSEDEVQRRQDMAGVIVRPDGGEGTIVGPETDANGAEGAGETLGHNMLKHFGFAKGYINLNCGSFGATPLVVTKYCDEINRKAEERPDAFFRLGFRPILTTAREKVATLLGAEADEIVIVPNVTHAINTILHNFDWDEDDYLIGFSCTYYAVKQTLAFFHDKAPHPNVSIIDLNFPASHAEIVQKLRDHLRSLPSHTGQKVFVVIDTIVSTPGCLMPWEEMVKVCREENAWSVVDGAHGVGILDINLSKAQPDFWTSNCHKWLFTKKPSAVLYVPRRHQHLIRTSFPTSWGYVSPPETIEMFRIFEYTGTIDVAPQLSIIAALEFRESIGGEKKIRDYIRTLGIEGGKRAAEILGTELLDSNGELLNAMTNVRLPISVPKVENMMDLIMAQHELMQALLDEYDAFVSIFIHNETWYARFCAQVWNDLSDFEYTAKALKVICERKEATGKAAKPQKTAST